VQNEFPLDFFVYFDIFKVKLYYLKEIFFVIERLSVTHFKDRKEYEQWKAEKVKNNLNNLLKKKEEERLKSIWICPECMSSNDNPRFCSCGYTLNMILRSHFSASLTSGELYESILSDIDTDEDKSIFLLKYLIKRFPDSEEVEKAKEFFEEVHLINCPVCENTLNIETKSCPKCGEALTEEKREKAIFRIRKRKIDTKTSHEESRDIPQFIKETKFFTPIKILGIIIGGLIILFYMFSGDPDKSILDKTESIVKNSYQDGSVYQIKDYLEKTLKDQDSFEVIKWGKVIKSGDKYLVRCKYRFKDSFGNYVTSNQGFTLDSEGNVIKVVNFPVPPT
jgi:ssDNA-binding Zn-finger/Zn-ribbon topoisomerase 1